MEQFFSHFNTVESIKSAYRTLAMQHHPDRGGDAEVMKEINRQYHEALKSCDGKESDNRTYTYKAEVEQELMDKLLELLKLRSLDISLIGYWIWVSGETRKNKDALKAAGLLWHSKRKLWYYKPKGWKRTFQSKGDFQSLAKKYGYRGYETADKEYMPTVQ